MHVLSRPIMVEGKENVKADDSFASRRRHHNADTG